MNSSVLRFCFLCGFGFGLFGWLGGQVMRRGLRRADVFGGLLYEQFRLVADELEMVLLPNGAELVAYNGDDPFRRRFGMPVHGQGETAEVGTNPGEVAIGPAFVESLDASDDDSALVAVCQFM